MYIQPSPFQMLIQYSVCSLSQAAQGPSRAGHPGVKASPLQGMFRDTRRSQHGTGGICKLHLHSCGTVQAHYKNMCGEMAIH